MLRRLEWEAASVANLLLQLSLPDPKYNMGNPPNTYNQRQTTTSLVQLLPKPRAHTTPPGGSSMDLDHAPPEN